MTLTILRQIEFAHKILSRMTMKLLLSLLYILAVLFLLGWLGLQIKTKPFPPYAEKSGELKTISLPAGLPAPVKRFYKTVYGGQIPVIETAVISGRGAMRLAGLDVPIRFRFTHEVGQNYRHDIDLTFFGFPIMKGYDTYLDGRGFMKTPGGVEQGAGIDQGSNVSLWAEALYWFPAVLVTDARVRWEPVDNTSALLVVPFGAKQDVLVVRFDPETGLMQYVEAMKYKSAAGKKVLWINSIWIDEGKPWIRLNAEDTFLNVDVHDYMRADPY
jgi:hypothetical protein